MARTYKVWDSPTRWFHWINFAAVVLLLLGGYLLRFRAGLAIDGREAKAALKILHTWVGYVFVVNLLARIVWGFVGNRYARWRAVLPGRGSIRSIGPEIRSAVRRQPFEYLGRTPIGRISVTIIFVVLLLEAGSGLVRAGTDIFYPPFGWLFADFLAKPGVDPDTITWHTGRDALIGYRLKYVHLLQNATGLVHRYSSYLLMGLIVVHISGVALTEIRQRSGVISAMFSGNKVLYRSPVDADESDEEISA